MRYSSIWCLMVSGAGLTDRMRSILFDTAQAMLVVGSQKKVRFRHKIHGFDGMVVTKFQEACFCTVAGVKFEAKIESDETGTTEVRFLVRPGDIRAEDGQWSDITSKNILQIAGTTSN